VNLCFVCSEYPPAPHGGIGSVTQILSRALANKGHRVKVIGVYRGLAQPTYEEDEGVEVWRQPVPRTRLGWVAARFNVYRQIAKWAWRGDIDVVEAPDWEGYAAGWPPLPIPVIARLHGSSCYFSAEMNRPYRRSTYWIERAALRRSDFWCSVSQYTAAKTRELFQLKKGFETVIYNAVPISRRTGPVVRSWADVVFSGTLTAKKGVVPLIQAWPAVKKQIAGAHLHMFGKDTSNPSEPSMREALLNILPRNLQSSVTFYGHVARGLVLEKLRTATVAVFPSFAEAFAMAPLEAMAEGCATIYSTLGSGPELIEDRRDGLLVDPSKPEQIAAAIVSVLHDDGFAARLGAAGREKVRRAFSIDHIVRMNEEFYARCMERFRWNRGKVVSDARLGDHLHV